MALSEMNGGSDETVGQPIDAGALATGAMRPLPADAMALIPMRNLVLFPGVVAPLTVGRPQSLSAAQACIRAERQVGLLLQRDPGEDSPAPQALHWVGTAGHILRYATDSEGTHHLIVRGESRFRALEFLDGWPFLVARVARVAEPQDRTPEIEARFLQLKTQALEAVTLLPQAPEELSGFIQASNSPSALADMVASVLDVSPAEKQALLEIFALQPRLDRTIALLAERIEVLRLSKEIGEQTKKAFDERHREHVLREQLRQIQKELGEGDDTAAELAELRRTIETAGMPEDTLKHALKELKRLERMSDGSGEYPMLRTYLDWLVELPWRLEPAPAVNIAHARQVLDEDHYGLEKIKRRILEHLAVTKLKAEGKSPLLCFVGPPGVGKTSLGQSIARATGRVFQRVSLGGVHDEAEIRGHRRTYVGALPGNIMQALRRAGSRTAVLMLDEIDKLGAGGFHGDPASALLEVLDPEQNSRFRDNYLGVDFDLSRVMFIATANVLETIPGPLRDRLEVIQLPGYTQEEKLEIARRYLVKRQLDTNGLSAAQAQIDAAAIAVIIADYTREAGVRSLERELGAVLRHVAMQIAEGHAQSLAIGASDLAAILGAPRYDNEVALRTTVPGVATGLAWTPVGGDILFVEATRVPGTGKLILTGQLGEVMKESAQTALTLAKLHRAESLEKYDVHVHVPAGATPKDGPSAGVAIFLALVSMLSGSAVRSDVAMTGEISLRGLVLPVGGVKDKILAAVRAGIGTVLLPRRNAKDLEDVPAHVRARLNVVLLDRVEEALAAAMPSMRPATDHAA